MKTFEKQIVKLSTEPTGHNVTIKTIKEELEAIKKLLKKSPKTL